jgi:acetylornithine/succinyldiaminopimelate/putrescine aminotransferase
MITNRQLFQQYLAQTTAFPLMTEIEYAEGVYMYGPRGERYIDLISGIAVSNVGHRHPKVITAIKNQLDKYLHLMVYGELVEAPQVLLAKELVKTLPRTIDNIYFVNSGSEAIEGAIKLAKRYTGRPELISCYDAYHGSSHGALSISGSEQFKSAFRPLLPDTRLVRYNDFDDLMHITDRTAAVIIEPVQGEAGVIPGDPDYFSSLKKKCNEQGTLLIMDEIQTGFGRTGRMWGHEHLNIEPDIVVCAKGMGGGMPIGAFAAPKSIMNTLTHDPILGHITTFGGHPVSAAASLATLKVLEEESLITSVDSKASIFHERLQHEKIEKIRNKGLMMAVQFKSFDELKPIIDKVLEQGVLTDWFLFCDNAMRIAPPLVITEEQIHEACDLIISQL